MNGPSAAALLLALAAPLAQAETRVFEFNLAWSNQDLQPGAGVRTVGALFDGPSVARLTLEDVTVDSQERVQFTLEALFASSGLPFSLSASPPPSVGSLRFDAPQSGSGSALPQMLARTGPEIATANFGSFSATVSDGLDPAGDPNLSLTHGYTVAFTNRADSSFNDGETVTWQMAGRVSDFSAAGGNRPLLAVTNFRLASAGPADYLGVTVENVASVNFTGQIAPIPEPGTWAMWLAGLTALAAGAKRRRR
jgi:hypothetical protein